MKPLTVSSRINEQETDRLTPRPQLIPLALAATGAILLLAMTFAPWYRIGPGQAFRTAWQGSPLLLVLLLAVVLAGIVLANAAARGGILAERALVAVFALTMATTLIVVFRLFIERPGGNTAALGFGGYPALLAINLVKTSAVLSLARRRRRRYASPGSAARTQHRTPRHPR
jgi:asparagine N-glycosylation enzyme membrane subunit Stt3